MVQAYRPDLEVHLSVDLSAQNRGFVTRQVQAFDFAKLIREAKSFGAAYGVQKKFCQMVYNDSEGWVAVGNENDLELAYSFAARSENTIIFNIISNRNQPK